MEINIWQVLFQVVNFGVVLWLLTKFLYKPVLKLLDDRAKKINEGMALAEKNTKSMEEIEKLKKSELGKARKEAMAITRTAELEAKKAGDQLIEKAKLKAKDEASRILKNADSELLARQKALDAQVVELAVAMAQKSISSALSATEMQKITKSILSQHK